MSFSASKSEVNLKRWQVVQRGDTETYVHNVSSAFRRKPANRTNAGKGGGKVRDPKLCCTSAGGFSANIHCLYRHE